jgi:alpha-1,3-rhamnosyl/mannosyltransferase
LKTALWKNLTKRADHIITISEFSKDEIANFMSYPEEKITSIPLGVDLRYFEKLTKEQIQSVLNQLAIDRSFFLFIGSIQPRKNLVRLLQAHASLPKNYAREFPLVIAGKIAWDDGETVKAIQAAVTDKRCLWLNYVSDIEKRALLQATQGLIFASLYEGFGLPILEAFASGAPVITSNCTSMPEVAQDAGILVDPYKLDSIQAALLRLIEDGSLKQSLASKGRGVSKQFNWSKTAASTAEIYSLFA